MVLVDTSVWIEHFRRSSPALFRLLLDAQVLIHPFVIGELACGNLKHRDTVLTNLTNLPLAQVASNDEVLHLLEYRRLGRKGLGWIDTHLLASALLTNCRFWTLDKRLLQTARRTGIALHP